MNQRDSFLKKAQTNNSNDTLALSMQQANSVLPDIPDRKMVYNNAGRLYQLIENDTLKAEYIYNDIGQRTRKTLYQTDGITLQSTSIYHYSGSMLVTETTATGIDTMTPV